MRATFFAFLVSLNIRFKSVYLSQALTLLLSVKSWGVISISKPNSLK